ncbi:MAG: hypothetical protein ACRD1L_07730, partial [Terriglobales bacterium]
EENSVPVDLPAPQNGKAELQLPQHREDSSTLEPALGQTATATFYGKHFDTDASKLRAASVVAWLPMAWRP